MRCLGFAIMTTTSLQPRIRRNARIAQALGGGLGLAALLAPKCVLCAAAWIIGIRIASAEICGAPARAGDSSPLFGFSIGVVLAGVFWLSRGKLKCFWLRLVDRRQSEPSE